MEDTQMETLAEGQLALDALTQDRSTWPRRALDRERITDFIDLYAAEGPDALPPIEVIDDGEGGYILDDGWHRTEAASHLGWASLPAIVKSAPDGTDPRRLAFVEALRTAAAGPLPLTRGEKRAAIRRLIEGWPELSDRHIGRLVGVAHTTVSRVRAGDGAMHQPGAGETYAAEQTAAVAAVTLLRALDKLRESRGLGIRDRLFGDRMGQRLAEAARDAHGEDALEHAQAYRRWLDAAVTELVAD